jgi:hypothetical protein
MSAKLFFFRFSSENPELEAALHENLVAATSGLSQDWTTCTIDLAPGEGVQSLKQVLLDRDAEFDDALFFLGAGVRALTPGVFPLLEAVHRAGSTALGVLPDYVFGEEILKPAWRTGIESCDYKILQHAYPAQGNASGIIKPPVAVENFICRVGLWRRIQDGATDPVSPCFLLFSEGAVGFRSDTESADPLMILEGDVLAESQLLGELELHSQNLLCGGF